jgi:hypothetical protein
MSMQQRPESVEACVVAADRRLQRLLDRAAPHTFYRWLGLGALMAVFILRMFMVHGFYIVTYVLLIFILNQFILFLQPKDRASLLAAARPGASAEAIDAAAAAPTLPNFDAEEFRPFVRRLPEFHFWYSSTVATTVSLFVTFFEVFNLPVFWPVLVFYFIILFVATMHRQWLDMKRLKYVPWDIGNKKTYKSDPKKMSVKARDSSSLARAAMDGAPVSANPVPTMSTGPGAAVPVALAPTRVRASPVPR